MGRVNAALFAFATIATALVAVPGSAAAETSYVPTTTRLGEAGQQICAFSPDGEHLVWVGPDFASLERIELTTGVRSSVVVDAAAHALRLADDGRTVLLAVPGSGGSIRVVDFETGTSSTVIDLPFSQGSNRQVVVPVFHLADDGQSVIWMDQTTIPGTIDQAWRVARWDRTTGTTVDLRNVRKSEVDDNGDWTISPDGGHIALREAGRQSPVHPVFDVAARLDVELRANDFTHRLLQINPGGQTAIWLTGTGLSWVDRAGNVLQNVPLPGVGTADFHVSADGHRVVMLGGTLERDVFVEARSDGSIRDLDLPGYAPNGFWQPREHWSSACDVSADGRYLASATRDEFLTLHLLDLDQEAPRLVTTDEVIGQQLTGQIERLYRAYFGRSPDAAGLAYWRTQRASGRSLDSISSEFAESAEFIGRYGELTDMEFVDLVYENVLGREADPDGRDFWVSQLLADATRGSVMVGFSEAEEFVNQTGTAASVDRSIDAAVNRLYRAYLGRDGDDGGLTFWVGEIEDGRSTLIDVSNSFAGAPEFVARSGQLDDAGFVDFVYEQVLGRPSEPEGRAFWIGQIDNGMTRGELMLEFSESVEFILTTDSIPT